MANLETRVTKLEQGRPGLYPVAVAFDDEDEETAIERCCLKNGITRQAFDAAQYKKVIRVDFVEPSTSRGDNR
jgi:hypothetical protein